MTALTPMMRQYQDIKQTLPEAIMFFRMGDFYEMFFEEAKTASAVLNIALTARDGGKGTKVPMCGVPHHAAENYLNKLLHAGHKVAICEQVGRDVLAIAFQEISGSQVESPPLFLAVTDREVRGLHSLASRDSSTPACRRGIWGHPKVWRRPP